MMLLDGGSVAWGGRTGVRGWVSINRARNQKMCQGPRFRSTRMRIQASSRFEEVQSAPPKPHPPSRRPFAARSRRLILWLAVDRRASLPEGTHARLFASFGSVWVSTDGPCAGRLDGWGSIGPTAIDWPGVDQSRGLGSWEGRLPVPVDHHQRQRTNTTHTLTSFPPLFY